MTESAALPTSSSENWKSLVDQIQSIRSRNNVNWMNIMRIALEHAPEKTRAQLAAIQENDLEISRLNGMLAEG